jgi:hypothetical protein
MGLWSLGLFVIAITSHEDLKLGMVDAEKALAEWAAREAQPLPAQPPAAPGSVAERAVQAQAQETIDLFLTGIEMPAASLFSPFLHRYFQSEHDRGWRVSAELGPVQPDGRRSVTFVRSTQTTRWTNPGLATPVACVGGLEGDRCYEVLPTTPDGATLIHLGARKGDLRLFPRGRLRLHPTGPGRYEAHARLLVMLRVEDARNLSTARPGDPFGTSLAMLMTRYGEVPVPGGGIHDAFRLEGGAQFTGVAR